MYVIVSLEELSSLDELFSILELLSSLEELSSVLELLSSFDELSSLFELLVSFDEDSLSLELVYSLDELSFCETSLLLTDDWLLQLKILTDKNKTNKDLKFFLLFIN